MTERSVPRSCRETKTKRRPRQQGPRQKPRRDESRRATASAPVPSNPKPPRPWPLPQRLSRPRCGNGSYCEARRCRRSHAKESQSPATTPPDHTRMPDDERGQQNSKSLPAVWRFRRSRSEAAAATRTQPHERIGRASTAHTSWCGSFCCVQTQVGHTARSNTSPVTIPPYQFFVRLVPAFLALLALLLLSVKTFLRPHPLYPRDTGRYSLSAWPPF
jgi:hypothetical protein